MSIVSTADLLREAELRAYAVLDSESIPSLERIADLAAALCGMSVAEVNVVSVGDVVHVATTNRDHLRVPREYSFCSTVIEKDTQTYVVPDAREEQPFASSPYVTGEKAAIRSYASSRLVTPNGVVIGTLCVFDSEDRTVDDAQLSSLAELANLVVEILELRRSERELAGALTRLVDSNRELTDSNQSLEAFAGQISHDLQAPLTAVEVSLELLEDEIDLSDDARMLFEHARNGGRRMQRSITDLLDFAVLGRGSEPQPVDLEMVVGDVLDDLRAGLEGATIQVSDLPKVMGHEAEVRAVVQNLIANAVKFSAPQGDVRVHIFGTIDGDTARIVVSDNGPGVPEDLRESVFGLTVRADTSVEGYGIGLATCARIILARGGQIGVDAAQSGGAAFWFELPAAA